MVDRRSTDAYESLKIIKADKWINNDRAPVLLTCLYSLLNNLLTWYVSAPLQPETRVIKYEGKLVVFF